MTGFAIYPSLRDRRVLVTGGASGIGASIVEHFVAQGARVGFIDLDGEGAERLLGSLGERRAQVAFARTDLRDNAALRQAIGTLRTTLGAVSGGSDGGVPGKPAPGQRQEYRRSAV